MAPDIKIVEVDIVEGKAFVIFSDGKVALLEPESLYPFAVDSMTLTSISIEDCEGEPRR